MHVFPAQLSVRLRVIKFSHRGSDSTKYFTRLEPQNPSSDVSELHKIWRQGVNKKQQKLRAVCTLVVVWVLGTEIERPLN